jgi:hypothetical protein
MLSRKQGGALRRNFGNQSNKLGTPLNGAPPISFLDESLTDLINLKLKQKRFNFNATAVPSARKYNQVSSPIATFMKPFLNNHTIMQN